jgi:hypothetical protein
MNTSSKEIGSLNLVNNTKNIDLLSEIISLIKLELNQNYKIYFIHEEALNWKIIAIKIILKSKNDNYMTYLPDLLNPTIYSDEDKITIKNNMGASLFSAHLNYFYGIIVEQSIREIKRNDFQKELNYPSYNSKNEINDRVFKNLYGKNTYELWEEFCKNVRLSSRRYYIPSKIYCSDYEKFSYWLSKKRTKLTAPELNASLISRGLNYLDDLGIKDEIY